MASRAEDTLSEDSEGSTASSSSEDSEAATSADQDQEPSTSSSQPASRRKARAQSSVSLSGPPATPSGAEACGGPSAEASATSGGRPKLPMPKLDLKALFDYHSRKRQLRSKSRRRPRVETATGLKSPEPQEERPRVVASKKKRREWRRERILQLPFVQKFYGNKRIPLRMDCLFEQETLHGFFKYIERLKLDQHLKDSLAQLDAADDLERESLEARRHKYLDDDGPLSPIEEPNGEDMDEGKDPEDIGARIVENSFFILSSHIPEKKKSKGKTKS